MDRQSCGEGQGLGLRAHYSVATAAKELSAEYYDKPVRYSYFEGCSNGGRRAMMMAQNYPELFGGIVSGAPSMFYPDLLFWLLWTGEQQIPEAGKPPVLSDAKRTLITKRILDKCDALDGLVDLQITNPRAWHYLQQHLCDQQWRLLTDDRPW